MPRSLRILLLIAGLAVIALLIRHTGPQLVWSMLLTVGWRVPVIAGIYGTYLVTRGFALWGSAPAGTLRLGDALRIRLSGDVIESLTFTQIISEPARGWLLTRQGMSIADAFGTIAIEFVLYDIPTSVMEIVAVVFLLANDAVPHATRVPFMLVLIVPVSFLSACTWAAVTGRGVIAPAVRKLGVFVGTARAEWLVARFAPSERVLVDFLHVERRRFLRVLAFETTSQLLLVLEVWLVLTALGYASPLGALVIEGGAKLISLVFVMIPGQVGASESVYALLARGIGVPAAAGLTLALVRRIRNLLVAGIVISALTFFTEPSPTAQATTRTPSR